MALPESRLDYVLLKNVIRSDEDVDDYTDVDDDDDDEDDGNRNNSCCLNKILRSKRRERERKHANRATD